MIDSLIIFACCEKIFKKLDFAYVLDRRHFQARFADIGKNPTGLGNVCYRGI